MLNYHSAAVIFFGWQIRTTVSLFHVISLITSCDPMTMVLHCMVFAKQMRLYAGGICDVWANWWSVYCHTNLSLCSMENYFQLAECAVMYAVFWLIRIDMPSEYLWQIFMVYLGLQLWNLNHDMQAKLVILPLVKAIITLVTLLRIIFQLDWPNYDVYHPWSLTS